MITVTVRGTVGGEPLESTATIDVQGGITPALGVFGTRTDGSPYVAPVATAPFGTHAYGGPGSGQQVRWGQPLGPQTVVANMRPLSKPSSRLTESIVDEVLAGGLDWLWSGMAADVKALGRTIIGTVWHEPLGNVEFVVGEDTRRWSLVFAYVMDAFAALGVKNVVWHSCLMASQYKPNANSPQGGDTFHTSALISRLDGLGADLYLTANSRTPATDPEWQAFADYHPDKPHSLLEFALWSDPDHQDECFALVDDWYRDHPSWTALVGFFNNGGTGKDGRMSAFGATVWDQMARDPFYGRTAV